MHRTVTLVVAGLLAAGTALATPPELIALEIPEARFLVSVGRSSGGCAVAGGFRLANGESTVVEGECPPGQPVSFEVALIGNAVVVTMATGFDAVSFEGSLLNIAVPNLAPTMPLLLGGPHPNVRTYAELLGEIGGSYAVVNPLGLFPGSHTRSTIPVLGGDTVTSFVIAGGAVTEDKFRFEVYTAAPPPSAITREEFDDLQQRLARIESLPGIIRRLARVPGLELALLLVPGAWLYRRRAGLQR